MAIQYPLVQTKLTQFASKKLSELVNFPVTVNSVYINWFDVVQFNNVVIKDTTGLEMIDVIRLEVDFKLKTLIHDGNVYIDDILIAEPNVRLVKRDKLNIDHFIQNIKGLSKKKKKSKSKKRKVLKFHIDEIDLLGAKFSYDSENAKPLGEKQFDPNHINFEDLTARVRKLRIAADTIELQIDKLSGYENNTGLNVKEISTFFRFTKRNMSFTNLYASWGESVVRDSLVFKYRTVGAFGDFINRVHIYADLKQSIITTEDLAYFAPTLYNFKEKLSLSGSFKGTISNFRLKKMNLSFGEKSKLEGAISFTGLPDFFETLLDFNFKNSEIHAQDLKQYIPNEHYQVLRKFGDIAFDAEFVGFINDFATKGNFFTDLGHLKTDVNLKIATNYYKGDVTTNKFNLGRLIDNDMVQLIDIKGDIEGTGLSLKNADFKLNAHIDRFGINGYDYTNIDTDGHFQQRLFQGELSVRDPNASLGIQGEINFLDSAFNFIAKIDSINLKQLNLIKDTLTFSTLIEADFKGLDPNHINGELKVLESKINYKSKSLEVHKVDVETSINKRKQRKLKLFSDFVNADIKGNFNFTKAATDFPRLLNEYLLSINRDDSLLKAYYTPQYIEKTKSQLKKNYNLRFNFKTGNLDPVFRLFMDQPPHISPGTRIDGEIAVGKASDFFITTQIDTIKLFDGTLLTKNSFALSTDKHFDQEDFSAEFMIQSGEQKFGGLKTNNFALHGFRHEHSFIMDSKINHPESGDYINLKGNLDVYPEHFDINLTNTGFRFLDKIWKNAGLNKIKVDSTGIEIKDLSFSSNVQKITMNGDISSDTTKKLNVKVQNFDLNVLKTYTNLEMTGMLNIDATLADIYKELKVDGKISLDTLHINDYLIGSLFGKTVWDNKSKKLLLETDIFRNNKEIIKITGGYSPYASLNKQLDMAVILQGASLEIAQPFVEGNVSNLAGTAIGYVNIKGGAKTPVLIGDVLVIGGKFTLDYLNTTYFLDDKIHFEKDFIGFKNVKLTDENHHTALLNGGLKHDAFQNMQLDLSGKIKNFQVLNTERDKEALYYGEAYASGTFDIGGDFSNIKIDVNAKSEKGTKLYIPLEGSENVVVQDYISFVSENASIDTLQIEENTVDLSGIVLNFNLDITPDAYMEIIFDKKAGDIIKGNGKGKLNMGIDTKGDFTMYGDIEITKGQYNFTLLNVVDKKFTVKPNSHITWSGDPYGAQLDIIASYTQRASLVPIMEADSSITSAPDVKRRYPVEVLLGLKGDLMSPNINFGIDITDYPSTVVANGVPVSLESYVAAFKQRIKNDEQELNRQAFSLIVLHKLSDNKFAISGSAGSSVSELLTNQLSYWVSQVDENLEIDVDLNGLDRDALNSFQLRLSYTFLDGRLRVTRDGSFTNVENQTNAASIFGDWTVEYLLAPDGHLKLKMYHKQNNNTAITNIQNNSTSGMSFLHTKSFNRITDFFVPLKKQALKDEKRKLRAEQKLEKKNGEEKKNNKKTK